MPPRASEYQSIAAALLAPMMWGLVGVFVRLLPGFSPILLVTGRFLVAAIVTLLLLLFAQSNLHRLISSLCTPVTWWLSLPAVGGYILGTTAFQMTPIGEATLLITTSPLFVIAYRLFKWGRIRRGESFGTLLAVAGIGLIVLPQFSASEATLISRLIGDFLALSTAGLLALYTLWFRKLSKKNAAPQTESVVLATFVLGSALLLPFMDVQVKGVDLLNVRVLIIFTGLGIISTALPSWYYSVAAQRLPAMLTTATLLLEPIFAALFAALVLQEVPSLSAAIGSVLVLGGLYCIARNTN